MKPEYTDTHKIVYPIYRDDLAEALVMPVKVTEVPEVTPLPLVRRPGPEEWRAK